jgi:peptidylprolyl isomerase
MLLLRSSQSVAAMPAQTMSTRATHSLSRRVVRVSASSSPSAPSASTNEDGNELSAVSAHQSRSHFLRSLALASAVAISARSSPALAEFVEPEEVPKLLCDPSCATELANTERVTLPSGLAFQDIKVGSGPAPPVGYQIVLHYILMTPEGRVISNSLENGTPYDIRVGTGQVVAGLDEGLKTMRVGGVRRVYVPGNLSFPKGLPAGPGRPRVPPSSPVVFDVQLLYIPGLEMEE